MKTISAFYKNYFRPGNICTDSRLIKPGDVFIALKGDTFNGNLYAGEALKQGASIAVIDDESLYSENTLLVDNTLAFLHELARFHKKTIGFHVLAVTGTNGKTTSKELIKSVLSQRFACQATEGNLNNHIGVPLSLLSVKNNTSYAIIEMGANHIGEIAQLCEIAMPESGIITNIGEAHLEGFGSFEGVVKAKSELYKYLVKNHGTIYYNHQDPVLSGLVGSYSKVVPYNGLNDACSVSIEREYPVLAIRLACHGTNAVSIESNLYGAYNLINISAAIAIGLYLGLTSEEIRNGIESYIPIKHRSQIIRKDTNTLLVDCYNANPISMEYAIRSFSGFKSDNKIVILGGMKELGIHSKQKHDDLCRSLETYHFKTIYLLGEEFEDLPVQNALHFANLTDLQKYLKKHTPSDSAILIKGSRSNRLELILDLL